MWLEQATRSCELSSSTPTPTSDRQPTIGCPLPLSPPQPPPYGTAQRTSFPACHRHCSCSRVTPNLRRVCNAYCLPCIVPREIRRPLHPKLSDSLPAICSSESRSTSKWPNIGQRQRSAYPVPSTVVCGLSTTTAPMTLACLRWAAIAAAIRPFRMTETMLNDGSHHVS